MAEQEVQLSCYDFITIVATDSISLESCIQAALPSANTTEGTEVSERIRLEESQS